MSPHLSIYLDFVRVLATLVVFVGHAKIFYRPLYEFCEIHNPGRDAVIVFFVLSGYVISWCAATREKTLDAYVVNRAARIYSVAIPAIVLGMLVSVLLWWQFSEPLHYAMKKPWLYVPVYLSFLGESWTLSETPPHQFPYWSIDYEVFYYVIFASWWYVRGMLGLGLAAFFALIAGPKIVAMFPLWVLGSLIFFWGQRRAPPRIWAWVLFLGSIAFFLAIKVFELDARLDAWDRTVLADLIPMVLADPILGDWLIGATFALNIVGVLGLRIPWGSSAQRVVQWSASHSFSIYLFHWPLFILLSKFYTENDSFIGLVQMLVVSLVFIYALSYVSERRKGAYRNFFKALIGGLGRLPVKFRS